IDLELRRSHFRMILLIFEPHRALHFRRAIDKLAQRVARQRMIIAAGVDVFELALLGVMALCVDAVKQETFDFVGGVQRKLLFFVDALRVGLQHGAQIAGVGCSVLIDHLTEYKYFAGAEDVRGSPEKSGPIDSQTEVAFALRRKSTNGRSVEGKVVPA